MRLFLKKRAADQIEFGIIYGAIALVVLGVGRLQPFLSLSPDCAFKGMTGIPCLTCGSTRSVARLSHGEFLSAFVMNPLMTLCLISAILYFFYSLVSAAFKLPRISILLTDTEKRAIQAGVVVLLLAQWVYLIILL
jgi:hypothetical protein